ncbi:MAG TPA: hypothetical protein VNM91_09435 [Dehalococcoidia bacterium]|nr:hypothetical protein [Dehalococcoidia bacterium]
MTESSEFFSGLKARVSRMGFTSNQPTPSSMNLLSRKGMNITVNMAPKHGRLSVKITINRGKNQCTNPRFTALRAARENESKQLDGTPKWDPQEGKRESKFELARPIHRPGSVEGWDEQYEWVERHAAILRKWVQDLPDE